MLLLFAAAVGKSAQFPLFPWLADAMEGPTPVSALIHAATMVTAGVYLMIRMSPVLALSHDAQLVIGSLGAFTAFVAATIACAQQDIKKVLAYSTVSQLGYMFLAVGTGAYEAAIFLMVVHAFFKAQLFLGAGSVIHALDGEQDLKVMGNLRRYLVLTFWTFLAGWLAIAGVPPLSGFWAKADVLTNAFARYPVWWAVGLATAALTAYYVTRLSALAFFGDDRWRAILHARPGTPDPAIAATQGHGTAASEVPHESPPVMVVPLVILALLAVGGGVLHLPWHTSWDPLAWLGPVFGTTLYQAHQSAATLWLLGVVDAVVALGGLAIALPLWSARVTVPALEPVTLRRAYFLDDIYDAVIGRPGQAFARFCATVIDSEVIDGAVNGVARLARFSGSRLRRVQTGFVRQYALGIVVGVVGLLAWMAVRALS
jgi:NADH-quinone oxidoreductase subunit L